LEEAKSEFVETRHRPLMMGKIYLETEVLELAENEESKEHKPPFAKEPDLGDF
jgi:hypothetical protein